MVFHLFDQLAGELDRLHVRAKGAAEDPFEKALDFVLDVPQDAHLGRVMPPAGMLTPRLKCQYGAGRPGCEDEGHGGDGGRREERDGDQGGSEAGDSPEASRAGER